LPGFKGKERQKATAQSEKCRDLTRETSQNGQFGARWKSLAEAEASLETLIIKNSKTNS